MNKDDALCSYIQQLCKNFDSRIVVIPLSDIQLFCFIWADWALLENIYIYFNTLLTSEKVMQSSIIECAQKTQKPVVE